MNIRPKDTPPPIVVTLLGKVAPDPNPEASRDPRLALGLSYEPGNTLVVNADKTNLMVIGTRKTAARRGDVSMQAGDFTILPTESENFSEEFFTNH